MEDLSWYTLLDGTHRSRGVTARRGQDIFLTDKEAKNLGDRVRRKTMTDDKVTETAKPTYEPTTVNETGDGREVTKENRDWSNTQDMKAPEVVALVNENDSKAELQALYETESKGQNRIGVLNAIKKRITQLEAD